ncbi:MAG: YggS family pyridoxal phosphate-dependent enzyme [Coriobacteriales bacterium]
MTTLKERWDATVADVERICRECGRDPQELRIVAVSKTVEPPVVAQAIAAGALDFGENRTKPFAEKHALYPQARWHLIGQLQSRKAREVVGKACLIHSVDRSSLLQAIQKEAAKLGVTQDILMEVSISGEESKGGVAPAQLPALLEEACGCPNVRVRGLMTMAPAGDPVQARRVFEGLRNVNEKMKTAYGSRDTIQLDELSMGMSQDYAQAIAEGATMVRIGRRIFSSEF